MADDASLYNAVERFTQCLQAGGVEKDRTEEDRRACNPTYRKTAQALDRVNRRGLFAIAAAEAVLLTALFFTGQSFLVIAMALVLAAAVTWLMDRRGRILEEHWFCPNCQRDLPHVLKTIGLFRYMHHCPLCGQQLETEPLSRYACEPDVDLDPRTPGNRACLVSGMVILLCALAGLALSPGGVGLWLALGGTALTGLSLLLLRIHTPEEGTFYWAVRRRDNILVPAFFCWPLGLTLLGLAVWSARQGLHAGFWAATGLLLTVLGALALLDRRNRALFLLKNGTLLRVELWGRRREITPAQVSRVRSVPGWLAAVFANTVNRALTVVDDRAFLWLWAAFTLVPAALVCLRTPRPRRAAQTVILTALLMLTGYSTACAADLVLQNLAHTAAPVQTQGAAPLTVQRKDGVRFLVTDKRGSALASFDCCVI